MAYWYDDAIFYSIYPLGAVNGKRENDYVQTGEGLRELARWTGHIVSTGCTAVSLAPVFESMTHGYDTADYRKIDSRLGTNDQFAELVRQFHGAGLRVVLDGVFNHTGRDFFAFRDLREQGAGSAYRDWYQNVSFDGSSPLGDPFTYECWRGHPELPRLNPYCPGVREYLLESVRMWIRAFDIDGIRLDCADCLDLGFMAELIDACLGEKQDFWLMGEIIHGDYNRWANDKLLHSVTNYECYKGLFSSHNDGNLHEIAYSLDRQFGSGGIYRHLMLYNFADNHDVDRVADTVERQEHLPTIYTLLYTMPGLPSLYYGSEWGIRGKTDRVTDWNLRPRVEIDSVQQDDPALLEHIRYLAKTRKNSPAIRHGDYEQLMVTSHQLAFRRRGGGEETVVAVNISDKPETVSLRLGGGVLEDFATAEVFSAEGTKIDIPLPAFGSRILRRTSAAKRPAPRQQPAALPKAAPLPVKESAPKPAPMPFTPPAPKPSATPAPAHPEPEPRPGGVQVVRMENVPARRVERHPTYIHERRTVVSTERTLVAFYELPPGKSAYPYHWHTGREEVYYILSGSGLLRTPEGEVRVAQGDLLYFPPGEAGAHRLINNNHEPLRYLDIDLLVKGDACVYVDSGKINIGGGRIFRLGEPAGHYDGE